MVSISKNRTCRLARKAKQIGPMLPKIV